MSLVDESPAAEAAAPPRARRRSWLWPSVAAAVVLLGAGVILWAPWRIQENAEAVRFEIGSTDKFKFIVGGFPKLSPDGHWAAFPAMGSDNVTRMWVRALDSVEVRPLIGTESPNNLPPPVFWSPDNHTIAFASTPGPVSPGQLKKLDIGGGPPTTICDVPGSIPGGTWNKEGVIVYATNAPNAGLWRVSAAGGVPVAVTSVDLSRSEVPHRNPEFLPDGKHFLYFRRSRNAPDYTGVYVGSIDVKPDQQPSKPLLRTDRQASYSPSTHGGSGYLLFLRDATLFAQPFDPDRLQLSGEPVPVADQVGSFAPADTGLFSVSTTGNLGYRVGPGGTQLQLTVIDRDGKAGTVGPKGAYQTPVFSPDGTRVAFSQLDDASGRSNIWVLDTVRGTTTRLTFNAGRDGDPVWSPDGKRIAFSSNRNGHTDLYVKPADGSGEERLLVKSDQDKAPTSWSKDGRWLLYSSVDPKMNSDIWLLPVDGDHQSRPFLRSEFQEGQARLSPDGRWVAYASQESGIAEIYIRPFSPDTNGNPSSGPKWMISKGGGANPSWRADGKKSSST